MSHLTYTIDSLWYLDRSTGRVSEEKVTHTSDGKNYIMEANARDGWQRGPLEVGRDIFTSEEDALVGVLQWCIEKRSAIAERQTATEERLRTIRA